VPQLALGLFDITADEWEETLLIFWHHEALSFIQMSHRRGNEPLDENCDLTEEQVVEVNEKLARVGLPFRYQPTGYRADCEGRFSGIRFVRNMHQGMILLQ
jgi:hypothetical protein